MSDMTKDSRDAAFRLAGKQFVKMTKEPIVAFLTRQVNSDDPSMKAKIGAFLDTEIGSALVTAMLSMGLSAIPEEFVRNLPVKRMARELRIQGMTDVGDVVADLLMEPLRNVIAEAIKGESGAKEEEPQALPSPELLSSPKETLEGLQEVPTKSTLHEIKQGA